MIPRPEKIQKANTKKFCLTGSVYLTKQGDVKMSKNDAVKVKERFNKIQGSPECPSVIQRLRIGQVRKDAIRATDTERGTKYEVSLEMGRMVLKRIVWEEKLGKYRFAGIRYVWTEE